MCGDRADLEQQEHLLDALWRLGLEELVGKAEAPDRVWTDIRCQVGAGPSRPKPPPRTASPAWRAVSQFVALAAVFLLLLGFRAELVQQGGVSLWQSGFPTPWTWPAASQPLLVGSGDALSAHTIRAAAHEQRVLSLLRYPSLDPVLVLRNQGTAPAAAGGQAIPATSGPQDQTPQPRDEGVAAPCGEASRALRELAQDPLLTHRAR